MGISITVYGGAGVVGGNKIWLEADGTTISFDFGINYARSLRSLQRDVMLDIIIDARLILELIHK
jgi:mRNA degradation ribonuclease J1/J2